MTDTFIWLGIAACLSQSAMFSGLNLAVFSLSRWRLEAAAEGGDANARRVLALRRNANFALTTILWGNVAVKKWIVLTDERNEPRLVTSGPNFIRAALFGWVGFDPPTLCHHPLIVRDATRPLGQVLGRLTVQPETHGDDVIDKDLILVWAESGRRVITGSDLPGRLLRGIARDERAVGSQSEAQPAGKTSDPTPPLRPLNEQRPD